MTTRTLEVPIDSLEGARMAADEIDAATAMLRVTA